MHCTQTKITKRFLKKIWKSDSKLPLTSPKFSWELYIPESSISQASSQETASFTQMANDLQIHRAKNFTSVYMGSNSCCRGDLKRHKLLNIDYALRAMNKFCFRAWSGTRRWTTSGGIAESSVTKGKNEHILSFIWTGGFEMKGYEVER